MSLGDDIRGERPLIAPPSAQGAPPGAPHLPPGTQGAPPEPLGGELAAESPLTAIQWPLWTAVGIVVLMVVVTLLSTLMVVVVREIGLGERGEAAATGAVLSAGYAIVLAVVWRAARRRGARLSEAIGLRGVPWWNTLGVAFGLALLGRLIAGVWGALLQNFDIRLPGDDVDLTRAFGTGWTGFALTVLLAVVLAPVVEEVVFRGVLLPALQDRFGTFIGIAGSSAAFAAVHIYLFAIPPIFVLAVILARSFLKTRSLWTPIAVHAAFNGVGVVGLYLLHLTGAL